MGTDSDDEDLMLNYRAGDAAAFEILYRRHKAALYRYILRQCKNESIAEELYQDVWMNLIKARERYVVTAKFTTWLYQMAHNRVIDHYRKQKHVPAANPETIDVEEAAAKIQDQPEQRAETRKKTDRLLELIDDLPEEQKQVFLLREESGMSINEIADTIGVNPETAKSRLRYAVNKLRKGLSEDESE